MHIQLIDISKRFGPVQANDAVSLDIGEGEVLALLGENGAGKSTLMKVLYGYYRADGGQVLLDGREVDIPSPRAAMALGIGMVFQQFSVIPALTVLDNLLLAYPGAPLWHGADNTAKVLRLLAEFAPGVPPRRLVSELSVGQKQQVELVKVLNLDARLIILDEPTSVLAPEEVQRLHAVVRRLAESGRSVVFITHKLDDVRACAHRVAVMRAGKLVAQADARGLDAAQLVALMVGDASLKPVAQTAPPASDVARISLRNLRCSTESLALEGIDLDIAPGEVLGVAGVSGNGQDLLADAATGMAPLQDGEVLLDGEVLHSRDTRQPHDTRQGYIPEYPLKNAVAAEMRNSLNLALRGLLRLPLFPRWAKLDTRADELMARYDVRPRQSGLPSGRLSGGNLQKLVIARELSEPRQFVVACYPTMGLDLHATQAVYDELFRQAAAGAAVLWISEDLDDLLRYAHRIAVLYHGRIAGVLAAGEADRVRLGHLMTHGEAA
uniref:Putative Monosaccharide-transporting ATPase (ABC-type transport system) n=1 Tax=mine drainage metagenome TaxID=410659 RepID=E6PK96_9ZZZZ